MSNAQLPHQFFLPSTPPLLKGQHMLILLLWSYLYSNCLFPLAKNTFKLCAVMSPVYFRGTNILRIGGKKISNMERKLLVGTEKENKPSPGP